MFAYCNNNPVNRTDFTGLFWKETGDFLSNLWEETTEFVQNTFGAGVVQARKYKALSIETFWAGVEHGYATSFVITGSVDKPISFYAQNASDWWKVVEYKVGIQFNTDNGGINYSIGLGETSLTVANEDQSLEFIVGINKIGYTASYGVDFGNFTSESYYHAYIRTIPTVASVAAFVGVVYYFSSSVLIPVII